MAANSLLLRLNSQEYKNWIKAGHCLLLLKDSLQQFIASEMKIFHKQLCSKMPESLQQSRCQCRAKGRQFQPCCPVCVEWKKLILSHHTNRNGEIHWGNCNPSLWPTNYWEVAKAYMPRGHADKTGPQLCDASALLNLINACDRFKLFGQSKVREVIQCRNDLMHSSNMSVSSTWLKEFGRKLQNFIQEFKSVPGVKEESVKIQQVLSSDWSVEDFVLEVDGLACHERKPPLSICEVERELIQQLLQEIYLQTEEQGTLSKEDLETLQKFKKFLSDNEDLQSDLQADIERLENLQRMHLTLEEEGCSL
ncbi:uncharacterized protein CXorf38 homolog [Pelodytes ibericus]